MAAGQPAAPPRDLRLRGRDLVGGLGVLVLPELLLPATAAQTGGPRRRRRPAPWRVARRWRRRGEGRDRVDRALPLRLQLRVRSLPPGPVLEGRADGKRRRQAVRLLVGQGAWRRLRLGVAAVSMIGARGALIAIVVEGD